MLIAIFVIFLVPIVLRSHTRVEPPERKKSKSNSEMRWNEIMTELVAWDKKGQRAMRQKNRVVQNSIKFLSWE